MENQKEKSKVSKGLLDHFKKVIRLRTESNLSCFNYGIALKHLEIFSSGKEIIFKQLSKEWFSKFQLYLAGAKGLKCDKPLSQNSANTYFRIVLSIAKDAADQRLIDHHLLAGIITTNRNYARAVSLTLDELHRLAKTHYRVPVLKNAFLFSCLTGIQWRDIAVLKWKHLQFIEGVWCLELQRDGKEEILPLSKQARELLGTHGNANDRIFKLHYTAALCVNLNQWALKAGVFRNITFQTARLTFGKMLLDNGIPIELVSELLGHKQVKTTHKLFDLVPKSDLANIMPSISLDI